jgi:quinoprotein glucose dehydrogenase
MKLVRQLLPLSLLTAAVAAPETYPCQNGLVRSLVAREPMLINPVSVAVDTDGSIYVTETTRRKVADLDIREVMDWVTEDLSHISVEQKRDFFRKEITPERFRKHPSLKDHNQDGTIDWKDLTVHSEKIHKLVDTDGDGAADKATVFAEGFNTEVTGIAAGVLARNGEVYATIAPDVWKLRDTDGDGKADERKAIASGFGVHINYAGHDMHGLTFGPDGKVYWTIGDKGTNVVSEGKRWIYPHEGALLRCNPDGSEFEVFARGLRNVQEIAFDDYGNIFGVDNDSDQKGEKERLLYIVEGSDSGWRSYYQYRGGKYNPWMDERIAFPDGEDRPASILPPLSLYLDGPSGFAYNPGTALNERYRGHFFLTQFPAGKINAFKLEQDGAAYKMAGDHLMASGTAFTGCNFGPDGALYVADWQGGYPLKEKGAVWKIDDPKEASGEVRKEVARMLKQGAAGESNESLINRLGHPDQRVRLDAQWELARREKWEELKQFAASPEGSSLARIHALWGLSQGERFDPELFISLAKEKDPELRAQAAKWCGECKSSTSVLHSLLADPSSRVRFHAAMAIGKVSLPADISPIEKMLTENGGKDPYLSYAGSFALRAYQHQPEKLKPLLTNTSPAVRLALATAFRNMLQDVSCQITEGINPAALEGRAQRILAQLTPLLADSDPAVVAEVARALHEKPIQARALFPLSELLDHAGGLRASTLRRAIAANRRIGDSRCLLRLARFAAEPKREAAHRTAALEALASIKSTVDLDPVDGAHAPTPALKIDPRTAAEIAGILSPLSGDTAWASAVASAIEATGTRQDPLSLARQALNRSLDPSLRISALRSLEGDRDSPLVDTALTLLADPSPALRTAAAGMLTGAKNNEVIRYIGTSALISPDLTEKQAAVRLLGRMPEGKEQLQGLLDKLSGGKLDPNLGLEVIEAASALLPDELARVQAALAASGPLGAWSYALAGGDAGEGKKVFEQNLAANCTACHRIGKEGSNVGPELGKIGSKDRGYLLQALIEPQASVAPGFGAMSITKKDGGMVAGNLVEEKADMLVLAQADGSKVEIPTADIATKTDPVSSMPPMGTILKPRELRDLIDYLSSLK